MIGLGSNKDCGLLARTWEGSQWSPPLVPWGEILARLTVEPGLDPLFFTDTSTSVLQPLKKNKWPIHQNFGTWESKWAAFFMGQAVSHLFWHYLYCFCFLFAKSTDTSFLSFMFSCCQYCWNTTYAAERCCPIVIIWKGKRREGRSANIIRHLKATIMEYF